MKIAINALGPSSLKTGIGTYVVNLTKELSRIDKTNQYVIFVNQQNAGFFSDLSRKFQVIILPWYTKIKPLRILWEQLRLPFLLRKMGVDILHSPGFVAPRFKTTKSVVTIHDMTFFSHPEYHTKSKVFYFTRMIPFTARNADEIIADSDNTKKEITKYLGIQRNKITSIHLGVSAEFTKVNKAKARLFVRDKYGIADKFLLFVGMIEPRKNLVRLVEAFLQIKAPSLKLVIVGKKGWHCNELFDMVKRLYLEKEVIFAGYMPDGDLIKFYNAAEAFVYPSLYEGFGIPVLEAMACGCPVITSNVSSLPEITGSAALLVNPKKSDEIANAIEKLLKNKNLHDWLSTDGIKRASQFSWRKTAEETLNVYYKVHHSAKA